MISKVVALGGKVIVSKHVKKIMRRNRRTTGVECSDGSSYDASLLVVATGSWTHSAFPELNLGSRCLATGYILRFYCFPRDPDWDHQAVYCHDAAYEGGSENI
jgi:glycine/D-amino acid oxidase-like deaminating enzyme